MKSRHLLMPALGLAVCAVLLAGCSKGGGGSSGGGSGSSKTSSSGGSGTPQGGTSNPDSGAGTGGGHTAAVNPGPVVLGSAYHFAVHSSADVHGTSGTVAWGNIGCSWSTYDTDTWVSFTPGYPSYPPLTSATVFGDKYESETYDYYYDPETGYESGGYTPSAERLAVWTDANAAWTEIPGRSDQISISSSLNGQILVPGVYSISGDATLADGNLVLDGSGVTDATWIFIVDGYLNVSGSSSVVLTGGAEARNVTWRVLYDATIGDPGSPPAKRCDFSGTILAGQTITINRTSMLTGRALASMSSLTYHYSYDEFGYSETPYYYCYLYGSVSILPTLPPVLSDAAGYCLLSSGTISNDAFYGSSSIGGDVGTTALSGPPPTYVPDKITGIVPADVLPGTLHDDPTGGSSEVSAMASVTSAVADITARDADYDLTGVSLAGKRLVPGVYIVSDASLSGTITFDGMSDPNSVWILRGSSATLSGSTFTISLINKADPLNIYWRVAGVDIGASQLLRGNVFSGASGSPATITFESGAGLQGRAFALGGPIDLKGNTIFRQPSGSPVNGFSPNGTKNHSTTLEDEAGCVAVSGSNMYVFGYQSLSASDTQWRLEKRSVTTGNLVTGFGSGGAITSNPGSGRDTPRKILVDGTGVYLFGRQETGTPGVFQWRYEKRDLVTGALLTGFGSGGSIVSPSPGSGMAGDLLTDGTYLYAVGDEDAGGLHNLRIEKRDLTGALVTGFGTGGVVSDLPPSVTDAGLNCLTMNGGDLYVAGWYHDGVARSEMYSKRAASDGALDSAWGPASDGYVMLSWSSGNDQVQSITTDGTSMFAILSVSTTVDTDGDLIADTAGFGWSVEVRDLATPGILSYVYLTEIFSGTGSGFPYLLNEADFSNNMMVLRGTKMWLAGSENILGMATRWRTEKRSTSGTYSLDVAFNVDGGAPGTVLSNPSVSNDRLWGITESAGILYMVGSDSATPPATTEWRMEARNR